MQVKEYLGQIKQTNKRLNEMQWRLKELISTVDGLHSAKLSNGLGNKGNYGNAEYTSRVEQIEILKQEIGDLYIEYINLRYDILEQIHSLDEANYMDLLYKKYMEFKTLKVIAKEMEYEGSYVRKLHGKALKAFADVLSVDNESNRIVTV